MAWRNIWRNRRRTLISVAALVFGTAALVFTHSFAETSYRMMIELATRGLLGHLQVHGRGYQANPDIFTVVKDPAAVRATAERLLPGAAALSRVTGHGLAAAGDRSAGVLIMGIEPSREAAHSSLLQLTRGRTLGATAAREVVVGEALARRLKVQPGSELVLLSQAADGSMANGLYQVVGLSAGGGTAETGGNALFLHLADAQDFFVLGSAVHQVVVNLPKGGRPREAAARLRAALDAPALEALSWNEMMPEVELGIEADRAGTFAMDLIVFLLVVLGMQNAMTMATYERMHELGVLAALGTRPRQVLAVIVVESLLLGGLGLAAGVLLGAAVIGAFPPLNMESAWGGGDFVGVALPTVLKVELEPLALAMAVVTIAITCLVGGLYPAWRAARMSPVEAMRFRS